MRKIFAIVLVALLLGVGVVALIETDPAMCCWPTATTRWKPVCGWALLLLALVLVMYLSMRLIYRLVGGQRSLVSWLGSRKGHHASRLTTRGLVSFLEGNWARARRQVLRGAKIMRHRWSITWWPRAPAIDCMKPDKVSEYLGAAADSESAAVAALELVDG